MEKVFRQARVHWDDASSYSGWHNAAFLEELSTKPLIRTETVGWLIHRDDKAVIVAMSVNGIAAADLVVIPSCMIVEMFVQSEEVER